MMCFQRMLLRGVSLKPNGFRVDIESIFIQRSRGLKSLSS